MAAICLYRINIKKQKGCIRICKDVKIHYYTFTFPLWIITGEFSNTVKNLKKNSDPTLISITIGLCVVGASHECYWQRNLDNTLYNI
jgi:hypothetical protein